MECGLIRLLQLGEAVTPLCPSASDSLKRIMKLVQCKGSLVSGLALIVEVSLKKLLEPFFVDTHITTRLILALAVAGECFGVLRFRQIDESLQLFGEAPPRFTEPGQIGVRDRIGFGQVAPAMLETEAQPLRAGILIVAVFAHRGLFR